jgi:hypothetical protein
LLKDATGLESILEGVTLVDPAEQFARDHAKQQQQRRSWVSILAVVLALLGGVLAWVTWIEQEHPVEWLQEVFLGHMVFEDHADLPIVRVVSLQHQQPSPLLRAESRTEQ